MNNCIKPTKILNKNMHGLTHSKWVEVPCGKCLNCMSARVSALTQQVLADCRTLGNRAIFITLTYDDAHATWLYDKEGKLCMNKTGYPQSCLVKSDYQHFLMRFRKNNPNARFHYILNGEYGDEGNRAHYHILMWGIGMEYQDEIKKAWTDEKGYLIGRIDVSCPRNLNACVRYILGYMTKEHNEKIYYEEYEKLGMQMPFHNMSKGIGKDFYLDHLEEERRYSGKYLKDGNLINMPRYWKNKLGIFSPNESIKDVRGKLAEQTHNYKNYSVEEVIEYNKVLSANTYEIFKIKAKEDKNYVSEEQWTQYEIEKSKKKQFSIDL